MPVLDFFLNDISPVTKNLRFDITATLPVLRVRVMDGNDPFDLTGATATFTMKDKDGNTKILNAAAIIEGDGSSGIVRYEWIAADTDVARIYFAQFTITLAGDDLIVPNDADQVLRIIMGKADFQRGTVIQQPVAQGIQVVALGGTPTLDAIGRWFKVVVSALDFTAAAGSESIDLFQLPAGGIVEAIKTKHAVAFAGGAISAYTVEVGSAAQTQKYMSLFDVFSAPSPTNHRVAVSGDEESHTTATAIKVTGKATGGNVGDATVGTVEIWIKASTVLGTGGLLFSDGMDVQADGASVVGGPFTIINFNGFALVVDEGGAIVGVTAPTIAANQITDTELEIAHKEKRVVKSADQSKSLDATLADDSELTFAIGAGETWEVDIGLFVLVASISPGFKYRMNYTGAATAFKASSLAYGDNNNDFNEDTQNGIDGAFGVLRGYMMLGGFGSKFINIKGAIISSTGGTVSVQWAQNTSDVAATTLQRGSYIMARRVL